MLLKLADSTRKLRVSALAIFVVVVWSICELREYIFIPKVRSTDCRSKTVVLIGAYGNSNFGDDIVAVGILRCLETEGYDNRTILGRRSNFRLLEHDLPDSKFVQCGDGFKGLIKTWRNLPGVEGVAILGGGGLLEGKRDDVNVHRLVLEYSAKLLLARLKGHRTFVHGIGISSDLYSSRLTSYAVRRALRSAERVSVRDRQSVLAAQSAGVDAVLVKDPATAVFRDLAERSTIYEGTVGIVLLDGYRWPSFLPVTPEKERLREEFLTELALRIEGWSNAAITPLFFAFHDSDLPLIEDVLDVYVRGGGIREDVRVFKKWKSCIEPFKALMECESIFSMRFHPALAGLTAGRTVQIEGPLQKLNSLRDGQRCDGEWSYPTDFNEPSTYLVEATTGTSPGLRIAGRPL